MSRAQRLLDLIQLTAGPARAVFQGATLKLMAAP
jgi:hypothetical protein